MRGVSEDVQLYLHWSLLWILFGPIYREFICTYLILAENVCKGLTSSHPKTPSICHHWRPINANIIDIVPGLVNLHHWRWAKEQKSEEDSDSWFQLHSHEEVWLPPWSLHSCWWRLELWWWCQDQRGRHQERRDTSSDMRWEEHILRSCWPGPEHRLGFCCLDIHWVHADRWSSNCHSILWTEQKDGSDLFYYLAYICFSKWLEDHIQLLIPKQFPSWFKLQDNKAGKKS